MSYHESEIPKGEYGEFSKITEEFLEASDAHEQNNPILLLVELSDLLGAIEGYVKKYNLTIEEVMKMSAATRRSFESGERK